VQYVDQARLTNGENMLMPAAVFSSTGAGSDAGWKTYAAGICRQWVMSGEDWAAGTIY